MDPKRKKIYIIVIVTCILLSAGVLLWGMSGTPATTVSNVNPAVPSSPAGPGAAQTSTQTKTINLGITYVAPVTFPQNKSFDFTVIKSIQNLQDFQAIKLTPEELGRDNPLKNY